MFTFKQFINQQPLNEKKMSRHEIAVKAHKGENVGHGNFDKVADKAAKEYGSKEAGKKVAAAIMWKKYAKESDEHLNEAPKITRPKLTQSDVDMIKKNKWTQHPVYLYNMPKEHHIYDHPAGPRAIKNEKGEYISHKEFLKHRQKNNQ